MLKPQLDQSPIAKPLFPLANKPFLHGNGASANAFLPLHSRSSLEKTPKIRVGFVPSNIKASKVDLVERKITTVTAVVTVIPTVSSLLSSISIDSGLDALQDALGKSLQLELVSSELDRKTGLEKPTIKAFAHKAKEVKGQATYEAEFEIPKDFGEVGAMFVENEHHKEMFLKDIVLDGFDTGKVKIICGSWVQPKSDKTQKKRVFFAAKSYLPSNTPNGLRRLREEELEKLRGNGQGERKNSERIYDYDVYNDLGNPDKSGDLARPVLGGKQHPYPRRCRTGRPRCKKDPRSEKLATGTIYVPRDEAFSDIKELTFSAKTLYSALHALIPAIQTAIVDTNLGFPYFTAIDNLFNEGIQLPPLTKQGFWKTLIPRLVKAIEDTSEDVLRFETPDTMARDRFFWFSDEEFARQTLAGLNPLCIKLITEWPLKSTLDPQVYGPPESKITTEIIERAIKGFMTIDEAIKQKKLFILDYHDLMLPYVKKVRTQENTTLYGSRTVFFLTPGGTLRPLAIELVRPPMDGKPQWKEVYTPCWYSTGCWLWRLAKAQVVAIDSGYHQLVSHWLRTHCCTEPYIIATNRHLSVMHPIYRLLHPHFRYTMEINALAREKLINADGIIETSFSPGKYSMELSSAVYDAVWRFDHEALPQDLISRGMAVEDPNSPYGLKLTIEDYPYANDGLVLWDALKQWMTDYVNHYYPDPKLVASDQELQAWWKEIKNVGHGDKKDATWWPELKTPKDLVHIVTTIAWVASGHHAAVNFGQYSYAGYFPNRPTIARINMPTEDRSEEGWKFLMEKPEVVLLRCFPSQVQASVVMTVLDVLSNHSPDEEYLGQLAEPAWEEDPIVKSAFEKFNGKLMEFEGIVDARNGNTKLKNRNGAGVLPYELLKPFSESGVTGKGVPYSISI
ncbi:linoleate 13S-lipoxygenase 2-1, chloroplastic-like [Mangifera indica]|uniref:linoleate 13S-lipoxygenase 2-1, chloroplastic-like n=1 Tax=Mangifera indica TaxID=29780 RepID=UPI001CFB31F0|nr:linoleate 13S-lipoxygenase 2-1, chloroplastic-like [Mangifera indica]